MFNLLQSYKYPLISYHTNDLLGIPYLNFKLKICKQIFTLICYEKSRYYIANTDILS